MATILSDCQLITPFESISDGVLAWDEQGCITYAGPASGVKGITGEQIHLKDKVVAPGLVDIHVHGGSGIAFGLDDLAQGLEKYSAWAPRFGVTSFLPSITGSDPEFITSTIEAYVPLLGKEYPGALPLGLHLEGPYLNPQKHGAFDPAWLRVPSVKETQKYIDAGKGWIRMVTLAPELENADEMAEFLEDSGVRVALGHSNANYETASRALKGHFTHITHTFNAQSSFHHRQPGVIGAVLDSENITAEVIVDGIHVHPAAVDILWRCLGPERVVLITDAMPGAGLPDGSYTLMEQPVKVENGKALLPDGTLAGSTAVLDQCMRNMVQFTGAPLKDVVRMASYNPSRVIRSDDMLGSLKPGKTADVVVFDESMRVIKTFVKGKLVYEEK